MNLKEQILIHRDGLKLTNKKTGKLVASEERCYTEALRREGIEHFQHSLLDNIPLN